MHYHLNTGSDSRKCYSLEQAEAFAREEGPGTYDVVQTSVRLGTEHESWLWGRIILREDGAIAREKAETN